MKNENLTENAGPAAAKLNMYISTLLLAGLILSLFVVLWGEGLSLLKHASDPVHYHIFSGEPKSMESISAIVRDSFSGDAKGIMQLGLIILMGTPIARVLASLLAFAFERDGQYVAISALVLATLLYSLFLS